MKKILYSDLDGTLLTDWDKGSKLTEQSKTAIRRWINAGNYFSVATGRILVNATIFLDDPFLINLPLVCGNGTILFDHHNNTILRSVLIDKSIFLEAISYDQVKKDMVIIYSDNYYQYVLPLKNKTKVPKLDFPNIEITEEELLKKKITKLVFVVFEENHDQVIKDIKAFKTYPLFDIIPSSRRFIEVVKKGVSKGKGIKQVLKLKEIKNYKLYCVGDYLNDLSMFEVADISFATENAYKLLKEKADYIVSDNNSHPIEDVINYLLKE